MAADLVIKLSANAVGIQSLRMEGGRFEQKKQLTNIQLNTCHFDGVTFTGSFSGVDFGWWNDDEDASIKNCDFSNAQLKGVSFLQRKYRTARLPGLSVKRRFDYQTQNTAGRNYW